MNVNNKTCYDNDKIAYLNMHWRTKSLV